MYNQNNIYSSKNPQDFSNKSNHLVRSLTQTSVRSVNRGSVKVIVKQNHFTAGIIYINKKIFANAPRSSKNLFKMFGGGLGLNAEILHIILPFYQVEKIIIPYQGTNIETTPEKWRRIGIVSPFCNEAVDKQIIMPLDEINMNGIDNYNVNYHGYQKQNNQLSLFN